MAKWFAHNEPCDDMKDNNSKVCITRVFANGKEESEIFPLTLSGIAKCQKVDGKLGSYFKVKDPKGRITPRMMGDVELLFQDGKRIIITSTL